MSQIYMSEDVNIYECPELDTRFSAEGAEVSIGDLHANAMKLIFMLVKHGLITNISDAQYAELVEIYLTPVDELKARLDRFEQILDEVTFSPGVFVRPRKPFDPEPDLQIWKITVSVVVN